VCIYSVAREINTRLSLAIQRRGSPRHYSIVCCLHVPMRYNRTALSVGPEILLKSQNLYNNSSKGGVTHRKYFYSLFSTTFVFRILGILLSDTFAMDKNHFMAHWLVKIFDDSPISIRYLDYS